MLSSTAESLKFDEYWKSCSPYRILYKYYRIHILPKLFDTRFLYKHCTWRHVCPDYPWSSTSAKSSTEECGYIKSVCKVRQEVYSCSVIKSVLFFHFLVLSCWRKDVVFSVTLPHPQRKWNFLASSSCQRRIRLVNTDYALLMFIFALLLSTIL